jgi:ubiquinone/menaquinone biosynthesis C-methylase UbiE
LYERVAAGWALGWLYRAVANEIAATLPEGAGLLDIGTGPGRLLVEIADRRPDLQLFGVDPSEDMVEAARRRTRAAGFGDRIEVRAGSAESLPFAAASLDAVSSTMSAHHWADVNAAVVEQARVLRPGGFLWAYDLRRHAQRSLSDALTSQFGPAALSHPSLGRLPGAVVVAHRAMLSVDERGTLRR